MLKAIKLMLAVIMMTIVSATIVLLPSYAFNENLLTNGECIDLDLSKNSIYLLLVYNKGPNDGILKYERRNQTPLTAECKQLEKEGKISEVKINSRGKIPLLLEVIPIKAHKILERQILTDENEILYLENASEDEATLNYRLNLSTTD
jgi:hypothetical protein